MISQCMRDPRFHRGDNRIRDLCKGVVGSPFTCVKKEESGDAGDKKHSSFFITLNGSDSEKPRREKEIVSGSVSV